MSFKLPEGMAIAMEEAKAAATRGEVPVGACIVTAAGDVLARDGNRTLELKDATAHAEMLVIRAASQIKDSERLTDSDLYVTLEPCAMCAAALSHARIRRIYFGAEDPKMGAVENGPRFFTQPTCHHAPEVYTGIGAEASAEVLRDFFRLRR